MTEPCEREHQAADAARHIYASPGTGAWGDGNCRLLEDACRAAGAQLGAYDYRILLWLAGWEPVTCAVIVGWVTPAAVGRLTADQLAIVLDALEVAAHYKRDRAAGYPTARPAPRSCAARANGAWPGLRSTTRSPRPCGASRSAAELISR